MKFKKLCLIIIALLIFIICYAKDNEELIIPTEGLEVYSLESIKNSNLQNSEWNLNFNNLSMDDYKGVGYHTIFQTKKTIIYKFGVDYLDYEKTISNYSHGNTKIERNLLNFSFSLGKKLTFNRLFFLQIMHSFNYVEFGWDNYGDSGVSTTFSPSLDLIYGINFNIIDNLSFFYEIQKYVWYTNPKFKLRGYNQYGNYETYNVKVSDIYEKSQHTMGISIKF